MAAAEVAAAEAKEAAAAEAKEAVAVEAAEVAAAEAMTRKTTVHLATAVPRKGISRAAPR